MRFPGFILVLVLLLPRPAAGATTEEDARKCARVFGQALTTAKAETLRQILPGRGKVHVVLTRFGPEDGFFGSSQVEALIGNFLAEATVRSFEVIRLESDEQSSALINARAVLTDRQGRPGRVKIHLSFEPEDARWVLREIKEAVE